MWHELGFTEREMRGLPGRVVLGAIAPQVLLYLAIQRVPLISALVASACWSLGLQLWTFARRRALDSFLVYGFLFTVVQCVAALVAHSPAVYVGGGVGENLLVGLVFLGSVAISHPLLVELMGSSPIRGQSKAVLTPPVREALGRLTVMWAVGFLGRSMGLYVALTHLSIGQFLIVNALAGWPLNGVGALLSLAYLRAPIRRGHAVESAAVC